MFDKLFGKKKNNDQKDFDNNNSKNEILFQEPKICLFDFNEETINLVKEKGYNITSATLGSPIQVPNKNTKDYHLCRSNHSFPKNIHEYDIISINMPNKDAIPYNDKDKELPDNKNNIDYSFISQFPQTVFDPRPFASSILAEELNENKIIIVFASQEEIINYNIAKIDNTGFRFDKTEQWSNYSFYQKNLQANNKSGKEINITTSNSDLKSLFYNLKDELYYDTIFEHRMTWKNNHRTKSNQFIPLIENADNEIISFIDFINGNYLIFLPQLKNKEKLLIPLLDEILPDIFPSYFPYSTKFKWVNRKEYWLPNHKKMLEEKHKIQKKYENQLKKINNEIEENKLNYKFLHEIITQTDDNLVEAVKDFLEWLGFNKVKKMDDHNNVIKEEDLQIELNDGLLVIEVKGIGGTSKDSDCNQINKIKYRRAKERKKFDVFGLYIVNHQRYLPPLERENPPFTKNQIKDAENEERGLLTTWDLFRTYYFIKDNLATKKEIKNKLTDFGLVQLFPDNLVFLDKIDEIFMDGNIFIMDLDNIKIKINDELVVFKDNNYKKVKITNIQIDDRDVEYAKNAEVGIKINDKVNRNSEVYLFKN